jgi:hypothetical protein
MKTEKVITTGIIFGLVLSSILIFLDIGLYGGGIAAIIIGMTVGWLIENKPVKYTMISVSAYNLIVWTLIMLFDTDAKFVLGYEHKSITALFIGFIIIMIVFYSIIGSVGALITYKLKKNK